MRYKLTDYGPSNKRQYTFAVGAKDIEILLGLVTHACAVNPWLPDKAENVTYSEVYDRLRSMRKSLAEAHAEAERLGDDNQRRGLFKPKEPDAKTK